MVKPAPYPADAFAVNGLVSELADLKRAGSDSGEAKPEAFGLEKPVAKATIVWTEADDPAAKQTRTLEFGGAVPGTDIDGRPRCGPEPRALRPDLAPRRRSASPRTTSGAGSSSADPPRR